MAVSSAWFVSTFDMVNVADLDLLRQAREVSDDVTVAVLGDAEAERLHGRAPVVPEQERLGLVQALRITKEVVMCRSITELPVKGGDQVLLTDEEGLADLADVILIPQRRSASPQLRAALAHAPEAIA
ncbi:hypothetical protein ACTQ49_06915 [Luteococcus sp. Sow4_B9]|uniref:hypothetical protein n=1 Tax=Luteococcus sp. Sow4_B9 TaxID=3438792 RepID=UPI003F95ADEC